MTAAKSIRRSVVSLMFGRVQTVSVFGNRFVVYSGAMRKRPDHPIEKFLIQHDVKLVWLARELDVLPVLLRYYFREDRMPPHLTKRAVAAIREKGKALAKFSLEYAEVDAIRS